jgi:hypothetical protein
MYSEKLQAFAMLLPLVACSGCNDSKRNPESDQLPVPPIAEVSLFTSVADLTTAVGDTPIGIEILGYSQEEMDEVAAQLTNTFGLYTYPELEPVPVTQEKAPVADIRNTWLRTKVILKPLKKLEERWYVTFVKAVPELASTHIRVPVVTGNNAIASLGVLVSRFHPASHPLVRSIINCQGDTFILNLSENVTVDSPHPGEIAQVTAQSESCVGIKNQGSSIITSLHFRCPLADTFNVTIHSNKQNIQWFDSSAKEGAPLLKADASITLPSSSFIFDSTVGCSVYTP